MATTAGNAGAHLSAPTSARAGWQEFSPLFPDEQECLASFLALECAEVLAGAKPANILSLADKPRPCGRNLYRLWQKHGAELLSKSDLSARVLADRGSSILIIFFRPDTLAGLLQRRDVATVLGKAGYPATQDPDQALGILQSRMTGGEFPHEVGVFLGYPLKDVVGFMGWGKPRFTCQGPWKIYGDPTPSLQLAETHRACRCLMSSRLAAGCSPLDCLHGCQFQEHLENRFSRLAA
ncbi:DUF3793 family protein [Geomesophilobacter sediminis]|nr:DUF3793 family protein [Geomesophilobacter sediminis]